MSMTTDIEAVTNAQEAPGQRVQQESTVFEKNRILRQQMTEMFQAWASGQGQPRHESQFATQQEQYHSPEYHSYSFDLPANIEKPARKMTQEEMTQRVKSLERWLKKHARVGRSGEYCLQGSIYVPRCPFAAWFQESQI
ncbi:PREDICTED: uncharacterized protein LOC109234442 [Nicotiana attenuata]|uniref:uncharacterized protein LOC109234442 n=1 Tax=Nicotiana attenuata TaxID=49451 RepID=UPI000904A290|nr:PREDICTED: uncharacterized protein LOC109234442 [Nicotiana attenuata]